MTTVVINPNINLNIKSDLQHLQPVLQQSYGPIRGHHHRGHHHHDHYDDDDQDEHDYYEDEHDYYQCTDHIDLCAMWLCDNFSTRQDDQEDDEDFGCCWNQYQDIDLLNHLLRRNGFVLKKFLPTSTLSTTTTTSSTLSTTTTSHVPPLTSEEPQHFILFFQHPGTKDYVQRGYYQPASCMIIDQHQHKCIVSDPLTIPLFTQPSEIYTVHEMRSRK